MLNKKSRLSREILGILMLSAVIAVFIFVVIDVSAAGVMYAYCDKTGLTLSQTEAQTFSLRIRSLSFFAAAASFVFLFLFLIGQKLSYIKDIIRGVESLRTHRMDYRLPVEGSSELAELAQSINYLAETERTLLEKEDSLQKEKDLLIRTLSHDIRTPLTAILSYSEYLAENDSISEEEMRNFAHSIRSKGEQINELTSRLLDSGRRNMEYVEDGRLLMEQLASGWEDMTGDEFDCSWDISGCDSFSGYFDIQELLRIFDNLASNIRKYADPASPVTLKISEHSGTVEIVQSNVKRIMENMPESRKIGIDSIAAVAENYGGTVITDDGDSSFSIRITLLLQNSSELHE